MNRHSRGEASEAWHAKALPQALGAVHLVAHLHQAAAGALQGDGHLDVGVANQGARVLRQPVARRRQELLSCGTRGKARVWPAAVPTIGSLTLALPVLLRPCPSTHLELLVGGKCAGEGGLARAAGDGGVRRTRQQCGDETQLCARKGGTHATLARKCSWYRRSRAHCVEPPCVAGGSTVHSCQPARCSEACSSMAEHAAAKQAGPSQRQHSRHRNVRLAAWKGAVADVCPAKVDVEAVPASDAVQHAGQACGWAPSRAESAGGALL